MGRTKTLPDGNVVEIMESSKVYGPDSPIVLNFGTSYPNYRGNGGSWVQSSLHHTHRMMTWLEGSSCLEDYLYIEAGE